MTRRLVIKRPTKSGFIIVYKKLFWINPDTQNSIYAGLRGSREMHQARYMLDDDAMMDRGELRKYCHLCPACTIGNDAGCMGPLTGLDENAWKMFSEQFDGYNELNSMVHFNPVDYLNHFRFL